LNPEVPAVAQQSTSPLVSVIVTNVLLNVAFTWATALVTFFRIFFLFAFAIVRTFRIQETFVKGPLTGSMLHILHTLFPCDCLLHTFTSTSISSGSLPSYRQTSAMPDPSVAANLSQTRDILLNLPTKSPFNRQLFVEMSVDSGNVIFGQGRSLSLRINTQAVAKVDRRSRPNTIEVGERDISRFIVRYVYTENTWHCPIPASACALGWPDKSHTPCRGVEQSYIVRIFV